LAGKDAKAQLAPSHTGGRADKGINAATRQLGIDRTDAQRAVKVDELTPEAKQTAREVGLDDNQSALLAPDRQFAVDKEQIHPRKHFTELAFVNQNPSPVAKSFKLPGADLNVTGTPNQSPGLAPFALPSSTKRNRALGAMGSFSNGIASSATTRKRIGR
jgi:ParB family chromosome partitioning protein